MPNPPMTTDTVRQVLTAQDSTAMVQELNAYQQFKLDSMTLANRAVLAEVNARNETHNIEPIIGVFIPIIAIIGGLWIAYKSIESKRAVKLALIEKGMDASLLLEPANENSRKYSALRFGLLLCGIGLGLIVGIIANNALDMTHGDGSVFIVIASAALFGGLGMVVYHLMAKKADQK